MICILLPGPWNGNQIPSLPYAKHLDSELLQSYMPINGQHLVWDLSVTEPLVIKKRGIWGVLDKLPNRWVRHQCLWVTAEIKCSALLKYKIFLIKRCLIVWILYLRKLSWIFCSPIGSKTKLLTWLKKKFKKKIEWLLKMLQRLYVCIPFIYMYA